jgi:hypothetical protein
MSKRGNKMQTMSVHMSPELRARLDAELVLAAHNVPVTVEGIQEFLAQRELDFAHAR